MAASITPETERTASSGSRSLGFCFFWRSMPEPAATWMVTDGRLPSPASTTTSAVALPVALVTLETWVTKV